MTTLQVRRWSTSSDHAFSVAHWRKHSADGGHADGEKAEAAPGVPLRPRCNEPASDVPQICEAVGKQSSGQEHWDNPSVGASGPPHPFRSTTDPPSKFTRMKSSPASHGTGGPTSGASALASRGPSGFGADVGIDEAEIGRGALGGRRVVKRGQGVGCRRELVLPQPMGTKAVTAARATLPRTTEV